MERYGRTLLQLLLLLGLCALVAPQNSTEPVAAVIFDPISLMQIRETSHHVVTWTTHLQGVVNVSLSSSEPSVASVEFDNSSWSYVTDMENVTAGGSFNVSANYIGYSTLNMTLYDDQGKLLGWSEMETSVILEDQILADIFSTSLGVLLALVYINMGATIDLGVIKEIIKKPIGPVLGILCQYGVMPLVAFGLSQMVFQDQPLLQLGMFLAGCCPGGGASNMWTHLLGGRLDLSITMTFSSTIAAFIAIPGWVLALGPVISQQTEFSIPFGDIAIIIVSLVVPCSVGLICQRFFPRIAKFLKMMLTPFSIFNVLYITTFGMYANRYIFEIIDTQIFLAALALPVTGYLIGLVVALLLRQPWEDAIAISVETGIQNTSIALFMINVTLEKPASSFAIVVPGCSVLVTPVPLLIIYLTKTIYGKVQAYRHRGDVTKEPVKESSDTDGKSGPPLALEKTKADVEKTKEDIEKTKDDVENNKLEGIDNPAVELSDGSV